MPAQNDTPSRKSYVPMLLMGSLSILLYGALFWKEEAINNYFPRGGAFALLPIGTALIFSFIHGSFTSRFWSAMGIEAAKRKAEENA